jgi:uncharacterized HAD superfamily protein
MHIAVDIDGILTMETDGHDYANRTPNERAISKVNFLYENGNRITLYSARFAEDEEITKAWLKKHGVKYHRLVLEKLQYDLLIDDKSRNSIFVV